MKIYTKTGDGGDTHLLAPGRVRKDHPRIEAYGTVDELNAMLAVARASSLGEEIDPVIARAQNELFSLGAQLAAPDPAAAPKPAINEDHVRVGSVVVYSPHEGHGFFHAYILIILVETVDVDVVRQCQHCRRE